MPGCEKRTLRMFAAGSKSVWRNYVVYNPTVDIYTVTANQSHDATIVWFQDRWIALWDDGTEAAGQRIWQSTSFDLATWTTPIAVFTTSAGSSNPVTAAPSEQHYQPSLVIVDGELQCLWMVLNTCYLSRLTSSTGLWQNHKLYGPTGTGAQYDLPFFDGYAWSVFAGNNGLVLDSGRVVVPVTLRRMDGLPFFNRFKLDSVIYSDDNGATWAHSEGTKINDTNQWEATVWEPRPGILNMVARNNRQGVPLNPKQNLKFSVSIDGGEHWTVPQVFVPIETSMSRMHALTRGDRNMLAHNDWAVTDTNIRTNRRNLTLFFNRGNGFNFTPGVNFAASDVVNVSDYPQIGLKDDTAAVIYTWEASNNPATRQTKVAKIHPLPQDNVYYIFPRTPRGHVEPATVDSRNVLRFHDDYSSAGLDLDANNADTDEITIRLSFKVESGNRQTILSTDEPSVKVIAVNGDVILKKWLGGAVEISCGTYSGWTDLEFVTGGGTTKLSVNGGAFTSIPLSPVGPIRAFLGENTYSGITAKPGSAFVIDSSSVETRVD